MDTISALLFDVTGLTVISLTFSPTVAVYSVTLPLKAGESVPEEIEREESELSPDFAASITVSASSSSFKAAEPDTIICAPAAVRVGPSAFT